MNVFDSRNPSVMNHDFSRVPHADIGRSLFRRPHTHKTTFDAGYLIPVFLDEVLPGDTFNLNLSCVARLATPIVPIMDNLFMDFHFFFVPNRLLWGNWEKFMGDRATPEDTTEYLIPTMDFDGQTVQPHSLADYFGLPTDTIGSDAMVSALPFRAYNMIWNQWYRDQNLQDPVAEDKSDGPSIITDFKLLQRGKRHDYFTSCLPWPQKGETIDLPLGSQAPVITSATNRTFVSQETPLKLWQAASGALPSGNKILSVSGTSGAVYNDNTTSNIGITSFAPCNLYADLTNATAATINGLREAIQLQRLLERDARGGTRYTEILHAHFGVTSPDARLQRAEYLGGGTVPVNIHSVPQTSETATTPMGTMAAYGYASQSGVGFSKAFVEHGYIMGLCSVRADLTYQRGINRMWFRQTKYDFYWPALAHLGEQEVLNKEIFFSDVKATDEAVFGYQERWAEYRYHPSKITGFLRSSHPQSLDVWHLSQDIDTLPGLDADFIVEAPPVDRVIAVPSEPHFIFDGYFDLKCARPMPIYSVPGLIDHF